MAITKKLTGHLSISTADYNSLINKPSINGIPLVGNVEIDVGESVDLSGLATKAELSAAMDSVAPIPEETLTAVMNAVFSTADPV